jgi:hypothetical protein
METTAQNTDSAAATLDHLQQEILSLGYVEPEGFQRCTEQEILELEARKNIRFPPVYREFLRRMGRGAGEFMEDVACFYPGLKSLEEVAVRLLEENGNPFTLPPGSFVFMVYQGYQFMYFDASGAQPGEPPIYYYVEGTPAPVKKADSFAELIQGYVNGYRHYQEAARSS